MVAACGPPVPPGRVRLFSSPCPPRSRRTHNLQLFPRDGQPLFSIWTIPHCQHTPVHAVRSRPCSSDERKLACILFSHFVKATGYEARVRPRAEKHPNLRLHCENGNSVALPLILSECPQPGSYQLAGRVSIDKRPSRQCLIS